MSKLSYWERRQVENMYHYMEKAEDAADQISKLYLKASRWVSLEADEIFERYATKHNLSEKEARRLLNTLQDKTSIDEMIRKLKAGNYDGSRNDLIAELESSAYRSRIEHLKQLQNQLDYVMKNIYDQEKVISTSHYLDLANEAYYRTIYDMQQRTQAAFSFQHIDSKEIDKVVNSKWSGKNYSNRIWSNTKALSRDIKEELLINLVTGRSNKEVADIIANKFAQGSSVARRLVRTESAYLSAELNFKAYKEMDIEEYQFLATLDLKTSEICRKMDLMFFKVRDRKVGVNCPPMHPWCRSTTVPIVDRKYLEGKQRAARDPITGKTIYVPRDMTYDEWYAKYVKGKSEAELTEKKIKNQTSDRKQYDRYREVLGADAPKSFAKFQEMKYNNPERWKFTQLDYKRRNELINHPEKKLPNAEKAILSDTKFTNYLFGGDNEKGLAKGRAFSSRLGYDISNWKELQREIQKNVVKYPAISKEATEYGLKYEQKMVLYGKNETPANVIVGWIHRTNNIVTMTSTYIKEVE